MGKAYMSRTGPRIIMRIEHRLTLEELQYALYRSNAPTDEDLSSSAVRNAVTLALRSEGDGLFMAVGDTINEADDVGGEEAKAVSERLAWARRMIARVYGPDFKDCPRALREFTEGQI